MNAYLITQIVVSALALASVLLAGRRKISAWPLLIAAHLLFLGYSAVTKQWGFWPLNVGMIAAGAANWRAWAHQPAEVSAGRAP